jgi:excisionase family DNA binding protein
LQLDGCKTISITSTGLSRDERKLGAGLKPLSLTVKATCVLTGLGPTTVWKLIHDGRLEVTRVDGRTLVKFPSVERLLSPDENNKRGPRKTPRKRKTKAEDGEAR